jgi:predicted metalloprotease with PDZ domain
LRYTNKQSGSKDRAGQYYPLWSPGDHAPFQHVGQIAGLSFGLGTTTLSWRRDLLHPNEFHITVPAGTKSIHADFDLLLTLPGTGIADFSEHLFVLRWNLYTLYAAGIPVKFIPVIASVRLPVGWQFGCSLPQALRNVDSNNTVHFAQTSLEELVDAPVLTGKFMRKLSLNGSHKVPFEIDVAAESQNALPQGNGFVSQYEHLTAEEQSLFGKPHFRAYRFLLAVSDYTTPGAGFEHLESSDDRLPLRFFQDRRYNVAIGDLLPHELAHSWNGKYRRPQDLYRSNFQEPEKTDLLWVYESLTNFLGNVLASRSGIRSDTDSREQWAAIAAEVDHETGRAWRNLQDTADSVPVTMDELFLDPPGWNSWLRMLDYYDEGTLIWLEANEIIDKETHGKKSLDDFCRLFFGAKAGLSRVKTYTAGDVYTGLGKIAPYDWKKFFTKRLTSHSSQAPLLGLEMSGWRLAYDTTPNAFITAGHPNGLGSAMYSIGLAISGDGTVTDVLRGGPSDRAGIVPGVVISSVNGKNWSPSALLQAIEDTATSPTGVRLDGELIGTQRVYLIRYEGGQRYPHLRRIENSRDQLSILLKPRAGNE